MKFWRQIVLAACLGLAMCCQVAYAAPPDDLGITTPIALEQAEEIIASLTDQNNPNATTTTVDTRPVHVVAPDDQILDLNMLYGSRVVIPEGTKYYASADGGGSGGYGTIGNRYTPIGTDLYVGGFAQLDENDRLQRHRTYNPTYVPVSDRWQEDVGILWDRIWVAIYLRPKDQTPLGWVPARSIVVVNGILGDDNSNAKYANGVVVDEKPAIGPDLVQDALKNPDSIVPEIIDTILPDPGNVIENIVINGQNPPGDPRDIYYYDPDDSIPAITTREIAYAIEDYADNGEKVALLLDASASVTRYMSDISSYGAYIDKVNKADIIITFAKEYQQIFAEEYMSTDVDGSGTDLYQPLNDLANIAEYDRIVIVTDTQHNAETVLQSATSFTGKIVVVCPQIDDIYLSVLDEIDAAFNTTVYLSRLDNELDRILALQIIAREQALYDSLAA